METKPIVTENSSTVDVSELINLQKELAIFEQNILQFYKLVPYPHIHAWGKPIHTIEMVFNRRLALSAHRAIGFCKQLSKGTDQFGLKANSEKQLEEIVPKIRGIILGFREEFNTFVIEIMLTRIENEKGANENEANKLLEKMNEILAFLKEKNGNAFCDQSIIESAKGKAEAQMKMMGEKKEKQQMMENIAKAFVVKAKLSILTEEMRNKKDALNDWKELDALIPIAFFCQFGTELENIRQYGKITDEAGMEEKVGNLAEMARPLTDQVKWLVSGHLSELNTEVSNVLVLLYFNESKINKFVHCIDAICHSVLIAVQTIGIEHLDIVSKIRDIKALIKKLENAHKDKVTETIGQTDKDKVTETIDQTDKVTKKINQTVKDKVTETIDQTDKDKVTETIDQTDKDKVTKSTDELLQLLETKKVAFLESFQLLLHFASV
ncbi:hypothetical protein niasHT_033911 [Heterodera trifolii]|uniref:Uncharacterized protein n=1 Tax=Heterodera trifolii TaxID=157864 RepID=A0ABD2HXK5_9BILA